MSAYGAGINMQLQYQGVLSDNVGTRVADGNYDLVFRLYTTATSGSALWTGTYTTANSNPIAVNDGIFSVALGSGTGNPLASVDFNQAELWLGVTVGTDSEMTPRQRITAAAYAFNANTLDGIGLATSTLSAGDLLYFDGSELERLAAGTNGQVLKLAGGLPSWGSDLAGSGGSGLFATSSDSLLVHPADTSDVLVLGSNATTTTGYLLEVVGASLFDAVNASSTLIVDGATTLGDTLAVDATTTARDIIPASNLTYNLGSPTNRWDTLYASSTVIGPNSTELTQKADGTFVIREDSTDFVFVSASTSGIGILTETPDNALTVQGGITLASTTVANTTNALYNQGGTLYWNGSQFNAAAGGTEGQTIVINSDGTQSATSTLFVANSGHVGIGDSSPTALLTVGDGDLFRVNSSGAIAAATGITSSGSVNLTGTLSVTATTTFSSDLVVDSSTLFVDSVNNQVGIGTAAPNSDLHIGSSWDAHAITFGDTNWQIRTATSGGLYNMEFSTFDSTNRGFKFTNNNDDDLVYIEGDTGYVGLGTTDPSNSFHIYGRSGNIAQSIESINDNAIINIIADSDNVASGVNQDALVYFYSGQTSSSDAEVRYDGSLDALKLNAQSNDGSQLVLANDGDIGVGTTTITARLTVQTTGTTDILNLLETGGTEVFTVLESGNVGIGTTTPDAALVVNGQAGQDLFRIATSTNHDILTVNAAGDLQLFGTITHNSPVRIKDGLQILNNLDQEELHIFLSGVDSSDVVLPSALDNSLVFETSNINNASNMEVTFWDTDNSRPVLILNNGGVGRASTFDRSVQIGKTLGAATIDGNYTQFTGFNFIDGLTGATGADLGVEDDIEAKGSIYAQGHILAPYFTATSASASSTINLLSVASAFGLGSDYLTDITGAGLTITGNALTVDTSTFNLSPSTIDLTEGYTLVGDASGNASATSSLFIGSDEQVGVGTVNPNYTLDVNGNFRAGSLDINTKTIADTGNQTSIVFDDDQTEALNMLTLSAVSVLNLMVDSNNNDSGYLRVFEGSSDTDLATELFRIQQNGHVGIGDSSPTALLTVGDGDLFRVNSSGAIAAATGITSSGAANFTGTLSVTGATTLGNASSTNQDISGYLTVAGHVGIGTTTPKSMLTIDDSATPNIYFGNQICNDAANLTGLAIDTVDPSNCKDYTLLGDGTNVYLNSEENGYLFFRDGNSNNMTIDGSTGYVGIGTTSPSNTLTLGGETTQFPAALKIEESQHATSNRASIQLGEAFQLNTDLFGDGLSNFGIWDGSAYRFVVRANGNVGIGTTSPIAALSVAGDSYFTATATFAKGIVLSSTTPDVITNALYSQNGILHWNGSAFAAAAGGTEGQTVVINSSGTQSATSSLFIDTRGHVGIGDTTPQHILEIQRDSNHSYLVIDTDNDAGYDSGIRFRQNDADQWVLFSDHSDGGFYFNENTSDTRLTIAAGGHVGIGTTSPSSLLHVSAGTEGDAALILEADTDNSNESDNPIIIFKQDGGLASGFIGLEGLNSARATDTIANAVIMGTEDSAHLQLITNDAARLTVLSSGNVSIGTTTATARLNVQTTGTSDILNLFETGGNEVFTVQESGNVGIGTTSPASLLTVGGSGAFQVDSSGNVTLADSKSLTLGSGGDFTMVHDGSDTTTLTANTRFFTIDNTTNNGITKIQLGTDTTSSLFEIVNDTNGLLFSVDGAGNSVIETGTVTNETSFLVQDWDGYKLFQVFGDGTVGIFGADADTPAFTPTALLHLGAGTTSTPPLRFTDGSLATTSIGGTLEYEANTGGLYFTGGGYKEKLNSRMAASMASSSVDTWTSRSAPAAEAWQGVTWSSELGLFAAVSSDGSVMTSPDGVTWTNQTAAEANSWKSIEWSPELGLFAAVSNNGTNRVMTSPDGVTWTPRSAAAAKLWIDLTWSSELGLFVAVAQDSTNNVMTSADGSTWTSHAGRSGQWDSITWSPERGLFVAVGVFNNLVMTSPDGSTWTTRSPAQGNTWRAVAWAPELGLFAAVADNGSNRVMTSPDGITWTAQNAASNIGWHALTWAPELGLFIAAADNGTNRIMTSPDGVNWTTRSVEDSGWFDITWSPELGIAVGVAISGTNRVTTSQVPTSYSRSQELFTGRFGVGTTSPTSMLTVTGDSYFGSTSTFLGGIGIGTSSPSAKLDIYQDSNNHALNIDANGITTSHAVDITADSLTSGSVMNLYSSSSDSSNRDILTITNANSSAVGTKLIDAIQYADGNALTLVGEGNQTQSIASFRGNNLTTGTALNVNSNSTGGAYKLGFFDINAASDSGATALWAENAVGRALYVSGEANFMNGNIGVGTTSPQSLLHVEGTAAVIRLEDSDNSANAYATIQANHQGDLILSADPNNADNSQISFNIDGSEVVRFDHTGNVGIGTTTPSSLLEISAGTDGDAVLTLEADTDNSNDADNPLILFKQDGGTLTGFVGLEGLAGTRSTDTLNNALMIGSEDNTSVQLITSDIARLTVLHNTGNVGIGTSSPSADLEVAGNSGTDAIVWDNGSGALRHHYDALMWGRQTFNMFLDTENDSVNAGFHLFNNVETSSGNTATISFNVDGNDSWINSGDFGIGTTSPQASLHIVGAGHPGSFLYLDTDAANQDSGLRFYEGGVVKGHFYHSASGDNINLSYDSTTGLILDSSGNIGIATTSPSGKLNVYQSADGSAVNVDGVGVTHAAILDIAGDELATGELARLYSNSDSGGTRNLVEIINDHASAVNTTGLYIKQDGAGENAVGLHIDDTAGGEAAIMMGEVGVNDPSPDHIFTVDHNGDGVNVAYVNSSNAWTSGSADYAEYYYTVDTDLASGEAVCIDTTRENAVERCTRAADINLMGIISTSPAFLGNAPSEERRDEDPNYVIVGMLGQVPAMVTSENGAINPGDSLTSASQPGYIMKANAGDPTVGVALEGLDEAAGTINVLISRKNKSLTVETVEQEVTERIAGMQIEDDVELMVTEAVGTLNLDEDILAIVDEELAKLDIETTVVERITITLKRLGLIHDAEEIATTSATSSDEISDEQPSWMIAVIDAFFERLIGFGVQIAEGVASFMHIAAESLAAKNVTTEELCVGTTCVTEAELQALLSIASSTTTATTTEEAIESSPASSTPAAVEGADKKEETTTEEETTHSTNTSADNVVATEDATASIMKTTDNTDTEAADTTDTTDGDPDNAGASDDESTDEAASETPADDQGIDNEDDTEVDEEADAEASDATDPTQTEVEPAEPETSTETAESNTAAAAPAETESTASNSEADDNTNNS